VEVNASRTAYLRCLLLALFGSIIVLTMMHRPSRRESRSSSAFPVLQRDSATFPLTVGPTGRYLVDQEGLPFLIRGDAPWSLTHNLTFEEAVFYLENRRAQGFNSLIVSVPDAYDADGNPAYAPDRYGQQPFRNNDLTQPNPAYWEHVDRVFEKAESLGFLLLVTPAYLGAHNDGYVDLLKANGPARCRAYGLWLGQRYRRLRNIVWVHGGDRNPYDVQEEVRALALAIREVDRRHLHTAHWANGTAALDYFGDEGWLDVNSSYTYGPVAWRILADREQTPTRPTFLVESHYEGDFGGKTADDVRAYPYRAILSGAAGYVFGNKPMWSFGSGWEKELHSAGARYMAIALTLFASRPWYQLEPDRTHQFVVEGHWESGSDDGIQAAATGNGDVLVAYLPPERRQLRLNFERLSGKRVRAYWFNPRTGQETLVGVFDRRGTPVFEAPGSGDWLLVLDDEAKGYAPPGTRGRSRQLRP
jgi:hypothetical protein